MAKSSPFKTLAKVRRQTYRAARDMGNIQAVAHGPESYGKRYARRAVYRNAMRPLSRFLRKIGLG